MWQPQLTFSLQGEATDCCQTAGMADKYTHGHHDSVLRSHRRRTAENSAAYLLDRLEKGMSLLDVGCGPGTLTADLARKVTPGRVVGLDRSQSVLEEAVVATSDIGNVEIVAGNVYHLDFPNDGFDVVHAHQVLQHLTDPVAALREMARVCKPSGVVAVRDADYRAMAWWPPEPGLDQWRAVYQAVARANGAEPNAGRRLLSWALEAGLSEVTPSASVWFYATPEDREWWGSLWADRIVESDIAHQAVERGFAQAKELAEIAEGWRRWADAEDGWFVILHGEVLGRPG